MKKGRSLVASLFRKTVASLKSCPKIRSSRGKRAGGISECRFCWRCCRSAHKWQRTLRYVRPQDTSGALPTSSRKVFDQLKGRTATVPKNLRRLIATSTASRPIRVFGGERRKWKYGGLLSSGSLQLDDVDTLYHSV